MTAASPTQLLRPVHAARVWWPHRDLRTRSLAVPGPRLRQSAAPLITAQPHDSQLRCEQAFCEMPTVGAGRSVPQTELGARPRSICHGLVTENSPVPATSLSPGSKHQPTNTPPTGAPNSPKSRKNRDPTLTPRLKSSGRRARGSPRRSVGTVSRTPGPLRHDTNPAAAPENGFCPVQVGPRQEGQRSGLKHLQPPPQGDHRTSCRAVMRIKRVNRCQVSD